MGWWKKVCVYDPGAVWEPIVRKWTVLAARCVATTTKPSAISCNNNGVTTFSLFLLLWRGGCYVSTVGTVDGNSRYRTYICVRSHPWPSEPGVLQSSRCRDSRRVCLGSMAIPSPHSRIFKFETVPRATRTHDVGGTRSDFLDEDASRKCILGHTVVLCLLPVPS